MSQRLEVDVVCRGAELTVSGRLDVHSSAELRSALHEAIHEGTGDLIVHAPDLQIWDATGIGVLVGGHWRARRADRRLVLEGLAAREMRLLRSTRLHRALTFAPQPAGPEGEPAGVHETAPA